MAVMLQPVGMASVAATFPDLSSKLSVHSVPGAQFLFVLLAIRSDASSVSGWIRGTRKAGKITAKAVAVSVLFHHLII
ncbi:hypothetical protein F511_05828 [Dorcoceras hygrometricum]|uniref:Uncharacterized protein n=1 Tax=Dorcoceras hygrometricum TaxID=472368 RepID=A0A2Z7B5E7_9LAMI|nr:hypothetical protein F511_05828 [Dorcoceras hygrometricum]